MPELHICTWHTSTSLANKTHSKDIRAVGISDDCQRELLCMTWHNPRALYNLHGEKLMMSEIMYRVLTFQRRSVS